MPPDLDRYKEYLVKRISSDETYEDLIRFPRYIEIETVHACNAKCDMCTINDWQREKGPMKDSLFNKIAEEVIQNAKEIKRVGLFRDGEPLLDPKLPDRIAQLKQGGVSDISISTNVSLLNESKAVDILEAGIDIVILSVDSIDQKTYEDIRKGLPFQVVMENAIRFIELRDQINPKTRIWMRMIIQEKNTGGWPKYKSFWEKRMKSQDRVYSRTIFNWGGQLKGFQPVTQSYELNLPCVALWSLLVIFNTGDVPLCNTDFNLKHPLGSVRGHSISELWNSELMNRQRKMHLIGRKTNIDICTDCNVWDEPGEENKVSSLYAEPREVNNTDAQSCHLSVKRMCSN